MKNGSGDKQISRRDFVKAGAVVATGISIVPRHVLGRGFQAPSDKLNVATIGAGGQGRVDTRGFLEFPEVQVVAVCDVRREADYSKFYFRVPSGRDVVKAMVEKHYAEKTASGQYKGCNAYVDFRELLEKETGVDAVIVATTDNLHALASLEAIKRGKHVYCEKPLTHDIYEARILQQAARKHNVKTQMGNHAHSTEYIRLLVEWVQDGAIGDVTEVHSWTNRPTWPQGVERPTEQPVPDGLDWDRWIGPAPLRPYNEIYAPFNWRGWWDFGTGALGDMGCHIMDMPVWALELTHPTAVQASFSPFPRGNESGPVASIVTFEFPARGSKPPVTYTWYDGGLMPSRPKELEAGKRMPGTGSLLIGTKGVIMADEGGTGRIIPETAMQAYKRPPKRLKRVKGHYEDFVQGALGGDMPSSNFDVAGPLTEIVLLGNLAIRSGRNVRLEWDGPNMTVTNVPEANQYVKRTYREGWKLES